MRSSRTANTSPIAVTNAGTIRSQRKLFLIAVSERVVGEERLVVVEPDELVAAPVVEAADDRADRRVDDPDPQQDERGAEEEQHDAVPPEEPGCRSPAAEAPCGGFRRCHRLAHRFELEFLLTVRLRRVSLHLLRDPVDVVRVLDEVGERLEQPLARGPAERRRLQVGQVEAEDLRLGQRACRRLRDLVGIDARVEVLVRRREPAALRPDLGGVGRRQVLEERVGGRAVLELRRTGRRCRPPRARSPRSTGT